MATQSAIISIGFSQSGTAMKAGSAVATVQCGTLEAANQYMGGNGLIAADTLRSHFPSQRIPVAWFKGEPIYMDLTWYRFFDYIVNTQLGGFNGPKLSDITDTVASSSTAAIDAQNAVSIVAQTVNANADALAATVQVSQAAALPGATQIPNPTYTTRGVQP